MELIDEQGRILGIVNVIDALVVLVILAIVVAGVVFVLQAEPNPEPPETATITTTLDLGTPPEYIVERITTGDSYTPSSTNTLTVTDIYVAPSTEGARVLLDVELTGIPQNGSITYDGAPLRLGRSLTFQTDAYQVSGTIRAVEEPLAIGTTSVLLNTTADAATANAIEPGDTYTIAGRDVATVETVKVFGTSSPDMRRVFLGLSLDTVRLDGSPQFGETVVRVNAEIPFETDDYALNGSVRRVGAIEQRGEPATESVTLRLEDVNPTIAEGFQVGQTETIAGETIAEITAVETAPSSIVVTSQGGEIYLGEHPVNKDVTLTAELQIRETTTGPTFKGKPLQRGSTVVLDLEATTIEATVVSL